MPSSTISKVQLRLFIGVDCGVGGGITVIQSTGNIAAYKMPNTDRDLLDRIGSFTQPKACQIFAVVEQIGGIPSFWDHKQKTFRLRTNPRSYGKLMLNYGKVLMALAAHKIRTTEISPQKWQRHFGLLRTNKNESKTDKKNRHKEMARRLFPGSLVTHAIADSMLLAEYCRIINK